MKKFLLFLPTLLVLLLLSGSDVSAQSCFSGAGWEGPPAGTVPTANRAKPIYATCDGTQVVGGSVPFIVQFGGDASSVYGNTATGNNLRIQDTVNNPEIQLQFGTNSTDHWALYNSQSSDSLRVWGGGSDRVTILSSGYVGIGTTNPSTANQLTVESASTGIQIRDDSANNVAGTILGTLDFSDQYSANASQARIEAIRGATASGGDYPTNLNFYTTPDGSATLSKRLSIDYGGNFDFNSGQLYVQQSTGNIGIGTVSPSASLDVYTNRDMYLGRSGQSSLRMVPLSDNYWFELYNSTRTGTGSKFYFAGYQGANNTFTVDIANGRVGVKNSSPSATLDVVGNIKIVDGSESDGYVLMSDAAGLASWQPVSAASGIYSGYWQLSGSNLYASSTSWNVGIGTINPSTANKLTVEGASTGIQIREDSANSAIGTTLGTLDFSDQYSANTSQARIEVVRGATAAGGDYPTNLNFYTTPDGSATLSKRLSIGYNGYTNLHDAVGPRQLFSREDTTTGTGDWFGQIMFDSTDGGLSTTDAPVIIRALSSESQSAGDKGGYLSIFTKATDNDSSTSATERLRITQAGDATALQVYGNANATMLSAGSDSLVLASNENVFYGNADQTSAGYLMLLQTESQDQFRVATSGQVTAYGFYNFSDERLKDVQSKIKNVLGKLTNINPVYFYWKNQPFANDLQIGLIAQEVEKEFPELVTIDSQGMKSVAYDKFSALLLAALKDQQAEIDNINQRLDNLEKLLAD